MASALNQAAVLVVQIFLTNMFKYYGSLSVYGANIPIAASGVAFKLNGLFISVIVGIAQGLQPDCRLQLWRRAVWAREGMHGQGV